MRKSLRNSGILAGASSLFLLSTANGAVSLNFTDNDSTPTSATVKQGGTFPFSVKFTETLASNNVSGADYQVHASTNGVFEFLSRNSQTTGSSFTSPNGAGDAQLMPVVLNPNNGTDLGTSTSTGAAVNGPGTFELADLSFEVLPATPIGVYTLSFVSTSYSGGPPSYPSASFDTLGTFTVVVSVPEPASIAMLSLLSVGLGLRGRRQSDARVSRPSVSPLVA